MIFIAKVVFFVFVFIWVRWTLPRFRYDQLMRLGWAWFLPLALVNVLLTAVGIAIGKPWVAWVLPVASILLAVVSVAALRRAAAASAAREAQAQEGI